MATALNARKYIPPTVEKLEPAPNPANSELFIRINVPIQNIQKCLKYSDDETVLQLKDRLISSLHTPLQDELNFGLYLPPGNGHIGGFLNESICLTRCNFSNTIAYLELRYKRRVYRDAKTNVKQLKEANTVQKQKQFLNYVRKGNITKVKRMCDKGLDPNFHDPITGESPLSIATEVLDPSDLLDTLIKGGAHIDFRNKWDCGLTALHIAARLGKAISIQKLLSLGACTGNKDLDALTPLYHFLMGGQGGNDVLCAKLLILDGESPLGIVDHQLWQEIHQVCRFGHVKILAMLIQKGADIEAKNACGNTPLHICCLYNQLECCKLLLRCGADASAKNLANQTPADIAVISGHQGLGAFLHYITSGHLPNTQNVHHSDQQNHPTPAQTIYGTMPRKSHNPTIFEASSLAYSTISAKMLRKALANSVHTPQNGPQTEEYYPERNGQPVSNRAHDFIKGKTDDKRHDDIRNDNLTNIVPPYPFVQQNDEKSSSDDVNSSSTTSGKGTSLNSDDLASGNQSPLCRSEETTSSLVSIERFQKSSNPHETSTANKSLLLEISSQNERCHPLHPPPPPSIIARCEPQASHGKENNALYQENPQIEELLTPSNFVERVVILQTGAYGFGFVVAGPKRLHETKDAVRRSPHVILSVEEHSPAHQAGLKKGDQLLEINGARVEKLNHSAISSMIESSGTMLKMTVLTLRSGNLPLDQQVINAKNLDQEDVSPIDTLPHLHYVQNRFGGKLNGSGIKDISKSLPGRLKLRPRSSLLFNSLVGKIAPKTIKGHSAAGISSSIPERLNALFNSRVSLSESFAETNFDKLNLTTGHLRLSKSYTDGLNLPVGSSLFGNINSRLTRKFGNMACHDTPYSLDDTNLNLNHLNSPTDQSARIERVASISSFYNWKRHSTMSLTDIFCKDDNQLGPLRSFESDSTHPKLRPAPASYSKMPDRYKKRRMRNTLLTSSFTQWPSNSDSHVASNTNNTEKIENENIKNVDLSPSLEQSSSIKTSIAEPSYLNPIPNTYYVDDVSTEIGAENGHNIPEISCANEVNSEASSIKSFAQHPILRSKSDRRRSECKAVSFAHDLPTTIDYERTGRASSYTPSLPFIHQGSTYLPYDQGTGYHQQPAYGGSPQYPVPYPLHMAYVQSYIPPPPQYLAPIPPPYYLNSCQPAPDNFYGNLNYNNNNNRLSENAYAPTESENVERNLAQAAINKEINERRLNYGNTGGNGINYADSVDVGTSLISPVSARSLISDEELENKSMLSNVASQNIDDDQSVNIRDNMPQTEVLDSHDALMQEIRSFFNKNVTHPKLKPVKSLKEDTIDSQLIKVSKHDNKVNAYINVDHPLLTSLKIKVEQFNQSPTCTTPTKSHSSSFNQTFNDSIDGQHCITNDEVPIVENNTIDADGFINKFHVHEHINQDTTYGQNQNDFGRSDVRIKYNIILNELSASGDACDEAEVNYQITDTPNNLISKNSLGDTFTKSSASHIEVIGSSDAESYVDTDDSCEVNSILMKARKNLSSQESCDIEKNDINDIKLEQFSKINKNAKVTSIRSYSVDSLESKSSEDEKKIIKNFSNNSLVELVSTTITEPKKVSKETQTTNNLLMTPPMNKLKTGEQSFILSSHGHNFENQRVSISNVNGPSKEMLNERAIDKKPISLQPHYDNYFDSSTFTIETNKARAPILIKQKSEEIYAPSRQRQKLASKTCNTPFPHHFVSMDPLLLNQRPITPSFLSVTNMTINQAPTPPVRKSSRFVLKNDNYNLYTRGLSNTGVYNNKYIERYTESDSFNPQDICRRYIFASDRCSVRPLTVYSTSDLVITEREWLGNMSRSYEEFYQNRPKDLITSNEHLPSSVYEDSDSHDNRSKSLCPRQGIISRKAIVSKNQIPNSINSSNVRSPDHLFQKQKVKRWAELSDIIF